MWHKQKRNYQKELRIYKHKLEEYEKAQFQTLRNSVVAQAAQVAKLKSAEYQAEKASKAATAAARKSAKTIAAAERESLKAIAEASRPPTARELRMAARTVKNTSSNGRKTRKNRK
jgi:hypothetical protein